MATRMQQRRGTAAQWTAANPILAAGEIGFETDTSKFKMGNGSSTWSALQYFANAAELAAIVDGAPGLLDTLNELAASIGDDANFVGTVTAHTSATTSVHGIANTALLATTAAMNSAIGAAVTASATQTALDAASDATTKANAALAAAEDYADGLAPNYDASGTAAAASAAASAAAITAAGTNADTKIATHNSDTTNVHGIEDTALLATKVYADGTSTAAITAAATAADTKIATHNDATTGVHGIADTSLLATKSYADTAEADAITAAGTAADTKIATHNSATENVHGIANTALLATQAYVTTAVSNSAVDQSLLAGTGLIWDSADSEFEVDQTHITTATQTALDLKAPKADPTFTGTVSGVTKAHVGLGNVDNTSDTAKPVSTAQATAIATAKSEAIADATSQVNALLTGAPAALNTLDELAAALGDDANFASTVTTNLGLKAPLASPTFTGTVTVASAGIAFTDGTQTKAGVPSITNIPTALAAGAQTIAAGRADQFIPLTGAVVITLPATGYSTGQSIDFYQESSTGAYFATTNGVVGTPGLKLRTTNSVATAMKTSAGWLVFGDLSA